MKGETCHSCRVMLENRATEEAAIEEFKDCLVLVFLIAVCFVGVLLLSFCKSPSDLQPRPAMKNKIDFQISSGVMPFEMRNRPMPFAKGDGFAR